MRSIALFLSLFTALTSFSQSDTSIQVGVELYNKGEYQKAITFYKQVLTYKNSPAKLSNMYNNLGNAYSQTGNSVLALENYQAAIKIAEANNEKFRIAKTSNNIGSLYSEQGEFSKALTYYSKAEQIAREIKDSALVADCLNNKGVIYEQENKYNDALQVYSEALVINQSLGIKDRIAICYNNLGIVYKYLKDYKKSIEYYTASINLSKELGDQFIASANLNNLGNVYAITGDNRKAMELYDEALAIAKKIDATQVIIEVYSGMADAAFAMKQYDKAFELRKKYEEAKSEFVNVERSRQLTEMQEKYETEKKENKIKLLQQSDLIKSLTIKSQQKALDTKNILFMVSAFVFGLILVIIYFRMQKQKLRNYWEKEMAIKQSQENERLRIAKDIHDDLGSGLSKISLLAEYSKPHLNGNTALNSNISSISRTSKELIENMRDLVWALHTENPTLDNLAAHIHEYASDFLEELHFTHHIQFPENVPNWPISKLAQRNIYLSFKEALHNAVKHSTGDTINLSLTTEYAILRIRIIDNGTGFDMDKLNKSGNGIRNMKMRIEGLGGRFTLKFSENRTEVMIELSQDALTSQDTNTTKVLTASQN